MSGMVNLPPFGRRDDERFLRELNELTDFHIRGCRTYARIWPKWRKPSGLWEIPFLHVTLFKHVSFRTEAEDLTHGRTLHSSSTTSGTPSQILLDDKSSELQRKSSLSILKHVVGSAARPLVVLDSSRSLRTRAMSARIAAAMSLRPLATEIHFLMADASDPASVQWDVLNKVLEESREILVYGLTWILWHAWQSVPKSTRILLRGRQIHFVHSGGWKKLEREKIGRQDFDSSLLLGLAPSSAVVDFYGLVEQVGMIFPLCEAGYRHVPVWADCLVRDPFTLDPVLEQPGQLQLMNLLAYGAPYHSVLTEDMAIIPAGPCACGLPGRRFELLGRVPKAETRGCANV